MTWRVFEQRHDVDRRRYAQHWYRPDELAAISCSSESSCMAAGNDLELG